MPCENQEKPNLSAPGARVSPEGTLTPLPSGFAACGTADRAAQRRALLQGKTLVRDWQRKIGRAPGEGARAAEGAVAVRRAITQVPRARSWPCSG